MPAYDANRYYTYDELTSYLQSAADERPDLVRLHSVGRSYQGRELWLAEIASPNGPPPDHRPGYWMDGNTHASELAGSAACLYAIQYVLDRYGQDPDVTWLLDTRTLYILPRISPDGAEYCLTTGDTVRSNNRPYPFEERWFGLRPLDINGDGLLLQMRLQDPRGEWVVSRKDPRVMVKRGPDDRDGPFYRIFREGVVEDWDGFRVDVRPTPYGIDFNRNYPYDWVPEGQQKGAGPYPLSESETRAVVDFIVAHPNICGVMTYHTYSAAILRPYSNKPDDDMPYVDLDTFKALGARGTDLTGYPCISVYHDFRYGAQDVMHGAFDDWCFHNLGIYAFTTEIWSIGKAAGLDVKDHIAFLERRTEDDMLKILEWHDAEKLDAFVPWQPFEHPQLGAVEIGGWKTLFSWSNPPGKYLPEICEKLTRFALAHAAASPLLKIESFECEVLSRDPMLRKITLDLRNEGYLPTCVSQTAIKNRIVRPVRVTLHVSEASDLVIGKRETECDHLDGITNVVHAGWGDPTYFRGVTEGHRRRLEWLVRGTGAIRAEVWSERAGRLEALIPSES